MKTLKFLLENMHTHTYTRTYLSYHFAHSLSFMTLFEVRTVKKKKTCQNCLQITVAFDILSKWLEQVWWFNLLHTIFSCIFLFSKWTEFSELRFVHCDCNLFTSFFFSLNLNFKRLPTIERKLYYFNDMFNDVWLRAETTEKFSIDV